MDKKTKKKPIGYTKEQTSSMKKLFERVDPKVGDYVGGGTVTEVKNKKKMKRMQMGGMAMMERPSRFGRSPMGRMDRPAKPGMGGGDVGLPYIRPGFTAKTPGGPAIIPDRRTMKGGGLARKGVGMALAKGGIVKAPARSYKDMKAGAGSGVGRIQKTKIQRGR